MRRLWIHRRKANAACLAKMKVYIEDPEGDTLINSFSCRKLGDLKNGEKVSFPIGEEARRVFVVADSLSRNLYNEFAEIPAGEEDVILSGRNVLEPFSGNPFRFDHAAGDAVLENRQRVSRRGSRIMIAAVLVGILTGIVVGIAAASAGLSMTVGPKTFQVQELGITLTEEFEEVSVPGYAACFTSGETAVFVLREEPQKELFGELSLDAYGAMILANNGLGEGVQLQKEEGLTTFQCRMTAPDSEEEYDYYCGLFRSEGAYWLVQITTTAQQPEERSPLFLQWLKSVRFAE